MVAEDRIDSHGADRLCREYEESAALPAVRPYLEWGSLTPERRAVCVVHIDVERIVRVRRSTNGIRLTPSRDENRRCMRLVKFYPADRTAPASGAEVVASDRLVTAVACIPVDIVTRIDDFPARYAAA